MCVCSRAGAAAIHQCYCVAFLGGRFTAENRGVDRQRNEQFKFIVESVHQPVLTVERQVESGTICGVCFLKNSNQR